PRQTVLSLRRLSVVLTLGSREYLAMTNKRSSFRLTLESLESRDCPTVAYTFLDSLGGVLLAGNTSGAGITVGSVGGDVSVDGVDTGVAAASVGSASLQGSGGA